MAKWDEERRQEAVKMDFESLKHLSSLAGVTALVEIAVYRTADVSLQQLGVSLVFLAVCVGGALLQMGSLPLDMQYGGDPGNSVARLTGAYLAGLLMFAVYALSVPVWWSLLIVLALAVFLTFALFKRRRREAQKPPEDPRQDPTPGEVSTEAHSGARTPWWRRWFGV